MTNHKRYKIRYDRVAAVAIIFIIIIILLATGINKLISGGSKNKNKDTSSLSAQNSSQSDDSSSSASTTVQKLSYNYADIHKGDLILVNPTNTYTLPEAVTAVSIAENKGENYYVVDNITSLNSNVLTALNSFMLGYYTANNAEHINILEAYDLSKEASTQDLTSELSTGLSLRVGLRFDDGTTGYFSNEEPYNWVTNNAYKYGFITRYTEEKAGATGKEADASFFRYVGAPHAEYMFKNHLCLEEYIEFVKQYEFVGNRLEINTDDGKAYKVYYVPANPVEGTPTEISIEPGVISYSISGNNVDGFIVTTEVESSGTTAQTGETTPVSLDSAVDTTTVTLPVA